MSVCEWMDEHGKIVHFEWSRILILSILRNANKLLLVIPWLDIHLQYQGKSRIFPIKLMLSYLRFFDNQQMLAW